MNPASLATSSFLKHWDLYYMSEFIWTQIQINSILDIDDIQGDPKQTDTFEMAATLLWVYSGKKIKLNPSMGQRQYLKSCFRIRIFWKLRPVGELNLLGAKRSILWFLRLFSDMYIIKASYRTQFSKYHNSKTWFQILSLSHWRIQFDFLPELTHKSVVDISKNPVCFGSIVLIKLKLHVQTWFRQR